MKNRKLPSYVPHYAAALGLLAAIVTCTATGCFKNGSVIDVIERNKDILRLAVMAGVIVALEQHPDLAPGMHELSSQLAEDTSKKYTTLAVAFQEVRTRIQARDSYQARPPAQKLIIMELVNLIESRTGEYLRENGVDAPEEIQTYIREIAGWVRDGSKVYLLSNS